MRRSGEVYFNDTFAGILSQDDGGNYTFVYDAKYLENPDFPPVSLTLPKRKAPYVSDIFFPFFAGLLAEGEQKDLQLKFGGVAENDHFGRLLYSGEETIGAIKIKRLK